MVAESTASNLIIWRLLELPAGVEPATLMITNGAAGAHWHAAGDNS